MRIIQITSAALLAVPFAGAPALAQMNNDSMSDSKMKMSHSDMKKMKAAAPLEKFRGASGG